METEKKQTEKVSGTKSSPKHLSPVVFVVLGVLVGVGIKLFCLFLSLHLVAFQDAVLSFSPTLGYAENRPHWILDAT